MSIFCDWSTGRPRPLVSQGHRILVFQKFHNLAHCSIRSSMSLIGGRYVWHKMNSKIAEYYRSCQTCARSKVQTHAKAPVEPISVPLRKFDHLHVDLVGTLPPSSEGWTPVHNGGQDHQMVDRTSRWWTGPPDGGQDHQMVDRTSRWLTGPPDGGQDPR